MKKSRFLITGCCGFIGSHWAEKLLKNGHEVTGIDIKPKNKIFNEYKNFKYYKMSINNETLIKKLVKKSDIICHFAAIANPAEYLSDPYKVIQLDALAAIKIIDIVAKYKKKFIFTSTSEVYGKSSKVPFAEDDDRMLGSTNINRWCYSTSKSLVEHYLFAQNYLFKSTAATSTDGFCFSFSFIFTPHSLLRSLTNIYRFRQFI